MGVQDATRDGLRAEIERVEWYHTLELAPGVVTPGWFDTRRVVKSLPFPASLSGKRCLDVATFDGFWAFEMERRGADEVVAIDLLDIAEADWPPSTERATIEAIGRRKRGGNGFEVAKESLRSRVVRHEMNVYDVGCDNLGMFDFIYVGSLLLHLRDPVRALDRLRQVCRGEILIVDSFDLLLTVLFPRRPTATLDVRGRPWWWTCNVAGLVRLAEASRLRVIGRPTRVFMPPGAGQPLPAMRPRLLLSEGGREALVKRVAGDPHAVLRAVPA